MPLRSRGARGLAASLRALGARGVLVALLLPGAVGLLAGCWGAVAVHRSAPLERAVELNLKAAADFERGKFAAARSRYREALQISRAIEHVDGVAVNLLALATVSRLLGDREGAAQAVEELLADGPVVHAPARRSAAAYLRSLLLLDDGALPEARRWADEAWSLCRSSSCGTEGRIVNLQARIAFLAGEPERAQLLAAAALKLNKGAGSDEEAANSLRTMADGSAARGDLEEAARRYEAALVLDKKLGLPAKIRLDLIRLGDVAAKRGRGGEALGYYLRAREVSRGAGDEQGAAEAAALIKGLEDAR